MAESRRWSVESKEFELLIKGRVLEVRIFGRCKGKKRSIFLSKEEVA